MTTVVVAVLAAALAVHVYLWAVVRPVDWPCLLTAPPSRAALIRFVIPAYDCTYAQLVAVTMSATGRRTIGDAVRVEQEWLNLAAIVGDGFDLDLIGEVMRRARPGGWRTDIDAIRSVARDVMVGKLAATLDVPPELLVGPQGDAVSRALRWP